jgi:TonB family protein
MKQKIKIMEQRPQLSDEEIRSYMDFDRLLADKKLADGKSRYHYLKWVAPAIVLTALVGWLFFNYPPETVEQSKNVIVGDVETETATSSEPAPSNEKAVASPQKEEPKNVEKSNVESSPANRHENIPQGSEEKTTADIYVQAEPVKGYSDLYAYFNSNLVYPSDALKDSIQGVETVSFVVNTEGKPENITIKQSLGEPFEKEARRLIENMPLWKPATLNGKPVSSQMSIPLTFQIQKVNVNR